MKADRHPAVVDATLVTGHGAGTVIALPLQLVAVMVEEDSRPHQMQERTLVTEWRGAGGSLGRAHGPCLACFSSQQAAATPQAPQPAAGAVPGVAIHRMRGMIFAVLLTQRQERAGLVRHTSRGSRWQFRDGAIDHGRWERGS